MDSFGFKQNFPKISSFLSEHHFKVCTRCLLRWCNVKNVFKSSNIDFYTKELAGLDSNSSKYLTCLNSQPVNCVVCLDLLTDEFIDQQVVLIEKQSTCKLVEYQLIVSIPVILTLRDQYFLTRINLHNDEQISIKELFRVLLSEKLKEKLAANYKQDAFNVIGKLFVFWCLVSF